MRLGDAPRKKTPSQLPRLTTKSSCSRGHWVAEEQKAPSAVPKNAAGRTRGSGRASGSWPEESRTRSRGVSLSGSP